MSKKARERKRLIRILKSEGVPSDPKSVKEWQRKIQSKHQYWHSNLEHRIISRFQRSKPLNIVGGFARYMNPGLWEAPTLFLGSRLVNYNGLIYYGRDKRDSPDLH